jgi:hypothetical protein
MFYKLIAEAIESKSWIFHKTFETYYDINAEVVSICFEKMRKLASAFETKMMIE